MAEGGPAVTHFFWGASRLFVGTFSQVGQHTGEEFKSGARSRAEGAKRLVPLQGVRSRVPGEGARGRLIPARMPVRVTWGSVGHGAGDPPGPVPVAGGVVHPVP